MLIHFQYFPWLYSFSHVWLPLYCETYSYQLNQSMNEKQIKNEQIIILFNSKVFNSK